MVSPACRRRDLGLGGSGGAARVGAGTAAATGFGRFVLALTGSVGATICGGVGSGGVGFGGGVTGSSMILLFRGAESRTPLGLPRPRFSTASAGISANCCEFSTICSELFANSCEFSVTSAIYSVQEKNYLIVMVKLMFGSPVRIE